MKVASIALAILALAVPAGALAQVQDRIELPVAVGDIGNNLALGGADADFAAEDSDAIRLGAVGVVKAAVVIDRRGRRAIVRGPRGRDFVYRGRSFDRYRGPRFVYPRGYGYRRWRAGQLFPLALLAAPFAFAEYRALGLEAPPPGYRWVRYGPDLVLVNTRTREVEDVAYGAIDDRD